jgi:methylisocitrate lyase
MVDRIKAAVDARPDPAFLVMARTDALAVEGMEPMLERIAAYEEAGADAIFAEAMTDISHYGRVTGCVDVPVLANLTEFGMTPLYSLDALREAGVRMALYPLSAFRAMSRAAEQVYADIRQAGVQTPALVETMQTRSELYEVLGYHDYEAKLDELFGESKTREEADE